VRSLQFAAKHVFFSAVVPAWASCLPDHRWLDSDQQYHFVEVQAICNYHYEEAIIDNLCCASVPIYWTVLNIKLFKIEMDNG